MLLLAGCDFQADDTSSVSPRLIGLSLTRLSPEAQAVLDGGGELVWEVQNVLGRPYALATTLPATVPLDADLFLVLADAATCTPKCDVLDIVPFHSPADPSIVSIEAADMSAALLRFEW
ncbi:MAG: hypothetical protein AAGG50_14740 [Bacteroidota bacterium]